MNLAKLIDHTLLKPDAAEAAVVNLCREAIAYEFATVCVNPTWVSLAAAGLRPTSVKVCTVIGFPLGATTTAAKTAEAETALVDGAAELDMVINLGRLKSGQYDWVSRDIEAVVQTVRQAGQLIPVKVILETGFLTDVEKTTACQLVVDAGADYVKTSTGFGPGGATVADVRLLRQCVGPKFGVKASGGIRTLADALAMVEAGASRLGTSAGAAIMAEYRQLR